MFIDQLISALRANRLMRSRKEVLAFDNTLAALASYPLSEVESYLPEVFLVFDDSCKHHEVMWGLVHYVDAFNAEAEVRAFGEASSILAEQAPEWVKIVIHGWLNDETSRATLRQILPTLSAKGQAHVRSILQGVANEDEAGRALVATILDGS